MKKLLYVVVLSLLFTLPTGCLHASDSDVAITATSAPHFQGRLSQALEIRQNSKLFGYLMNVRRSTGPNLPQLYFTGYDFATAAPNYWNAPVLFNFETEGGNNRAMAIKIIDTSTEGPLNVTGLEVNIDSPPDRGGDSSGIYIRQAGGGNGLSVFKKSNEHSSNYFPNNGFAIESSAHGGATSIYSSAQKSYGGNWVMTA